MNKKVLIIYRFLPQWRVDFFNLLRKTLSMEGIELNLVYGKTRNKFAAKKDEVDLNWAIFKENRVLKVGNVELYWQPCLIEIMKNDLIIVEHANRLLINYFLMILRKISRKRLAFWGHGRNLQVSKNSMGNKFKRIYSKNCDGWFAYTEGVKKILEEYNILDKKITVVQNAIDTRKLVQDYNELSDDRLSNLRNLLDLSPGPVGLFCGGLYKEKRIDFLLQASQIIKNKIPNFQLIIIGAGPDSHLVENYALLNKWVHYQGPKFNGEKIPFFKLADVFLLPSLVGLAILDSFALQTPIITTNAKGHGPELEYLVNEKNGVIVDDNLDVYVQKVIEVLNDVTYLNILKNGCKQSASSYTIEKMVSNFSHGIQRILKESH